MKKLLQIRMVFLLGITQRLKRKALAILVIIMMTVTMLPAMAFAASPSDISNHWAKMQIGDWVDKGLVNGYSDGTFRPDNNITRAEFMVLVNGAFGYSDMVSIDYKDVTASDWYADTVAKAKAAGYIAGYTDGTVKPNNPISRQEAAIVIMQVKQLTQNQTGADKFTDATSMPAWSKGGIGAVVIAGIMSGYPDGTFKASNSITRAEAVVALNKALVTTTQSIIYDQAGTYGPATGTETVKGNVTIKAQDITLQNTVIEGNLIIDKAVGEGNATFKRVVVKGNTYVYGGGINSVYFIDTQTGKTYILKDSGPVRIVVSGNSEINQLIAQSGATIEEVELTGNGVEGIVVDRQVDGTITVNLAGVNVDSLEVNSTNTIIVTNTNTNISSFEANAAVAVRGAGTISNATINVSGVTYDTKFTSQTVAPGVSAPVQTPSSSGSRSPAADTRTITGFYLNTSDTALVTTATVAYGTAEATAKADLSTAGYAKLSDNSYVAITIAWTFDAAYVGTTAGEKAVTGTVSGTFAGGQTPVNQTGTVTVAADTRTITGYYLNTSDGALVTTATVPYGTAEATAKADLSTAGYAKLSDNSYVAITIAWAFDAAYSGNAAGAKAVTGTVSGTFAGGQTPVNQTGTVTVSADTRAITGYFLTQTDTPLVTTATVPYETAEATAKAGLSTAGFAKLSDNSYVAITIAWTFDTAYVGTTAGEKAVTGTVSGTFAGGQTPVNQTGIVTVLADARTITGYYTNNNGTDTVLVTTATVAYGTSEATAKADLSTVGYAKLSDNSYVAITIAWTFDAAYVGTTAGAKAVIGTVSGTFVGGQTPANRTGTVTVAADTRTITGYYLNTSDGALVTTTTVAYGTAEATAKADLSIAGFAKLSDNSYVAITIAWAFDEAYVGTTAGAKAVIGTVSGTFVGGQTPANRTGTVTVSAAPATAVTASSNGIATATGTTTITLGQIIPGLAAGDIIVKVGGVELNNAGADKYTLGGLASTSVTIAFQAASALDNTSLVSVVIIKDSYLINGGSAIAVANTIPAPPTDVTSAKFTTDSAHNIVTITLTGGTFKAGGIGASDFTFAGPNAAAVASGTFTRTSDSVVTITELTLVSSLDNTVLVKAATQATKATSVKAEASFNYFIFERIDGTIATTISIKSYNTAGGLDVVIPSTIDGFAVTTIGVDAFAHRALTRVTIPNSVTKIDQFAFYNNQLTNVIIPDSVTIIGWNAFRFNQLTNLIIPDSVAIIGINAFRGNALTSVIIPDGVNIVAGAFCENSLTSITIGAVVTLENGVLENDNFRNAYDAGGAGTYLGTQAGTWTKVIPISNLVATAGNAQVVLSWTAPTGATAVELQVKETSAGDGTYAKATYATSEVAMKTATTTTATGLTNDISYTFQLVVTGGVNGGKSNTVVATPVAPLAIGDSYGGGIVAYILQPEDPWYDSNVPHGLIAATADQSTGIEWAKIDYEDTSVALTSSAYGTGSANTDKIIEQNGVDTDYAAGLARAYRGGGYSDWYLPSEVELSKILANKNIIGGFYAGGEQANYWNSTENSYNSACRHTVWAGGWGIYQADAKGILNYVRAVRTF